MRFVKQKQPGGYISFRVVFALVFIFCKQLQVNIYTNSCYNNNNIKERGGEKMDGDIRDILKMTAAGIAVLIVEKAVKWAVARLLKEGKR